MRLDLHAVARFMRAADTETLLDRVTAYRAGMEPAALDLMEGELDRRGVERWEIAAHDADRRATCLFGPDGMAVRCDRCERPAVRRGVGLAPAVEGAAGVPGAADGLRAALPRRRAAGVSRQMAVTGNRSVVAGDSHLPAHAGRSPRSPSAHKLWAPSPGAVAMTAALLALALAAPPGGKYWVFLGTYTAKGGSQGIYRCEFDAATGKLGEPQLAAELISPSFVTLRPDGKVLYAVGETGGRDGGGVFAFTVDAKTGTLTKLDESTSGSGGPCHVSTNSTGTRLAVANYGGGSWKLFDLSADGKFGTPFHMPLTGNGPNKQRQEKPHAHCTAFDPTGQLLYVVDLGTDQLWVVGTGNLPGGGTIKQRAIKLPAGSGPRHLALDPAGGLGFVCGELDSTVNVVKLKSDGTGEVVQTLSTLPGGKPVAGNSTAEVVRHPSGKFVYVSNRGHNSVAAFAWDGQKLSAIGHATEGIKVPRNFNLSPDGEWMLVANQDGDDVVVFKVGADGLPTPTGMKVKVGKPVCVKFLPKG